MASPSTSSSSSSSSSFEKLDIRHRFAAFAIVFVMTIGAFALRGLVACAIALVASVIASLFVGRAFGRRLSRIQSDMREVATRIEAEAAEEKTRLEEVARKRTAEVARKNEELKFLLDNVGQGVVTVGRDGSFSNERSAIFERWFGPVSPASKLWEYFRPHDSRAARSIEVGWDALVDDLLPLELAMDQLPSRVETTTKGGKTFAIKYRPIVDADEKVAKLVLIISDITAEVRQQDAEAGQKELAALIGRFARDPGAVRDLVRDGTVLIDTLRTEQKNLTIQKRVLHTLTSNGSFFGLTRLASECDRVEGLIQETGAVVTQSELETIYNLWSELSGVFAPLVTRDREHVAADRSELSKLGAMVADGEPRAFLLTAIDRLMQEPMEQRLARVAEQARNVATRLGKPDVVVKTEANGVHLDAQRWAPFWMSIIHVVRNAIDHGIEDEATRRSTAKSGAGEIVLRTIQSLGEDVIEITDDGAGVDWTTLRSRARALGIAVQGATDMDLLFLDGVSSKNEVTEVSGRGIGLGAVRAECAALGGRIEVTSTQGRGTTFRFRFPRTTQHHTSDNDADGEGLVIIQRSMRPAATISIA